MKKYDGRHDGNQTKSKRELNLNMQAWCKWGSKYVDFDCEHNGLPVKGKVINIRYEGTKKHGTTYLELDNGVVDFPVPPPPLPEIPKELESEINSFRVYVYNKNQNNVGNHFIKENFKKILTDLQKLSIGEKPRRPLLHNVIYNYGWQEIFPLINSIV